MMWMAAARAAWSGRGPWAATEPPKKVRPASRSRRAKPNGADPAAEARTAPQLDLPEPSLIDYREGLIAEEVRQLHAANPNRSLK
jgi:hypothetical protein